MTTTDQAGSGDSTLLACLTIGFATAIPMWAVGFITHLPGINADPAVIGVLLLATLGAGLGFAGRGQPIGRAARRGLAAGIVTGLINMLVLGAALTEDTAAPPPTDSNVTTVLPETPSADTGTFSPNEVRPDAPLWIGGSLLLSALIGLASATAVSAATSARPRSADRQTWLARFALIAACSTLPVLLSGGLVTSTEAGLAVPDWPNSYGANMFLYPLGQMTGGIFYEHTHRLFGTLVGLTTLFLLVLTLINDRRLLSRIMVVGAFLLVVLQGILGGVRVVTADEAVIPSSEGDNTLSLFLAMTHGISGQVTFAVLCATAAILSLAWRRSDETRPDSALRASSTGLLIVLGLQLILGAGARHMGDLAGGFLHGHMTVSLIVVIFAMYAGLRARGRHREDNIIRRAGTACFHGVLAQFVLGWVTFWALKVDDGDEGLMDILVASAHQALGAALIGFAAILWVWTRKRIRPGRPEPLPPAE